MSIYTERFVDDGIEYHYPQPMIHGSKADKIRNDPSKHYPNKDEAALLRKIMSSTGLSEEVIRQDPKYRKQLSEAQKAGQKRKRGDDVKTFHFLIKEACKKTGLVPQHPDTIKALQVILDDRKKRFFNSSILENNKNLTAETIVKLYTKK